jgi:hypothetical protein
MTCLIVISKGLSGVRNKQEGGEEKERVRGIEYDVNTLFVWKQPNETH